MKIWLDVDPGHDDAFAIVLACNTPSMEVVGISTVYGNQSIEKTTKNALSVLKSIGMENIPVVKGSPAPICRKPIFCPEIHGESGMEGTELLPAPPMENLVSEKWITFMANTILRSHEKITIVATAALTNIALLLNVYPECKDNIETISILGGGISKGNITPMAEFNILNDPEAAHMVFNCGLNVVITPLDVSHTVLVREEHIQKLNSFKTKFGTMCADLLRFYTNSYKHMFEFDEPPLHDPIAVAYLVDPSKFVTRKLNVEVELASSLSYGQTICDMHKVTGREPNVLVNVSVDVEWFWELLLDALEKASARSPMA